jgi:uroporphyrinogen decarboxylase
MNSRERVLRVINHQEADRVPMFMDCTTEDVLGALIKEVKCKNEEEMLEKLNIDCRWCVCYQDFNPVNVYKDGRYIDMWGVEKTNFGGMPIRHPLEHIETVEELEKYKYWPNPDQIDYDVLINRMEQFPGYCVFGGMWSPFLEQATLMMGLEKVMTMMYEKPEIVDYILDKTSNFYLECNKRIFEKAGNKMQIFFMGDDYGTQTSLLYSPEMWRRHIKPRLKKIYDLAKEHGYKVMQHSCGSIAGILPDMIEIGLDGIHPIQVTAAGMEPQRLKAEFGDKVYFAGSIDAMRTLIGGTRDDIDEQIKDRIEVLGKDGGFILGPSQGFLPEIPVENIVFMYETAYKRGFYNRRK